MVKQGAAMKTLGILTALAGAFVLVSAFLLFFPYDQVLGSLFAAMSLVMIWAGLLMTRVK